MTSPAYPTQEAALKRAEVLKQSGIWPGVIRVADGKWILKYDPDILRGAS